MLRRALVLGIILGLLPAGATVVDAQGAPGLGQPLTFTDAEGITHGTVTVSEIKDPFLEFEPSRPPEAGQRYVLLAVQFEAALDQTFEAQPYMVLVQDTDGALWTRGFVPRPADVIVPELQGQTMSPGNRISGVIGYVLPEAAKVDTILFQPTHDRLAPLVDVAPGGGPAAGEVVPYTDAAGASVAVTVEAEDPFTGHDPAYPPEAGKRFVLLTVAYEDVGAVPYWAEPYDITVRDSDGYIYQRSSVYRPAGFAVPDLESQTLGPGDRIHGVVGFQVPAGATIVGAYYQPESARIVQVADLLGGGPVEPGPSAPPLATPSAAPTAAPVSPSPSASAGTGR